MLLFSSEKKDINFLHRDFYRDFHIGIFCHTIIEDTYEENKEGVL